MRRVINRAKVFFARHFFLFLAGLALLGWMTMAVIYIRNPPSQSYQHDLDGHIEYSQLIAREKKLPAPDRGWETYQPPLYYLINQLVHPLDSSTHGYRVRYISVVYGGLFAICLFWLLLYYRVDPPLALLVSIFIMSAPAVLQLFTSYNNDALAMALAALFLAALQAYYHRPCLWRWLAIFLVVGAGCHAKFSFIPAVLASGVLLCVSVLFDHQGYAHVKRVTFALLACSAGGLVLVPWLYFHNYRLTGKIFPNNIEHPTGFMEKVRFKSTPDLIHFLFSPPHLKNGEWSTPYAVATAPGQIDWSKPSLFGSALVTATYGEWDYAADHPFASFRLLSWACLTTSMLGLVLAILLYRPRARVPLLLAILALLSHMSHLSFVHPFANAANFRYYAWILLPLALVLGIGLDELGWRSNSRLVLVTTVILTACIVRWGFLYLLIAAYH